MFMMSKYFIFIGLGLVICFAPLVFKLIKKKHYGMSTFIVITIIIIVIGITFSVLRRVHEYIY